MAPHHTLVWLDHNEARVFQFRAEDIDKLEIHAPHEGRHLHSKVTRDGKQAGEDKHYYEQVGKALSEAQEILITGPASAKLALMKYLQASAPKTMEKVVGVESVDHPTDGQLIAYAKQYFKRVDAFRGDFSLSTRSAATSRYRCVPRRLLVVAAKRPRPLTPARPSRP